VPRHDREGTEAREWGKIIAAGSVGAQRKERERMSRCGIVRTGVEVGQDGDTTGAKMGWQSIEEMATQERIGRGRDKSEWVRERKPGVG